MACPHRPFLTILAARLFWWRCQQVATPSTGRMSVLQARSIGGFRSSIVLS